jgi:hypothetical protein
VSSSSHGQSLKRKAEQTEKDALGQVGQEMDSDDDDSCTPVVSSEI